MRFMSLWMPASTSNRNTPQMAAEMEVLIKEMVAKGVMVMTGGWDPHGPCTTQIAQNGEVRTIDGPYAESKEMIGGFAIMECANLGEVLAWGKRFMKIAGDGISEVRQLHMGELPPKP
jgi:hypothetical protein